MQNEELLNRIRQMAEEVTAREGCTVYDIEFVGGGPRGGRTLRLYIDKATPSLKQAEHPQQIRGSSSAENSQPISEDGLSENSLSEDGLSEGTSGETHGLEVESAPTGGVSIEDCSNVSRGLNLLLDVEDLIPGGAYSLEVSSPGLERVLRERWHYERVIGKAVTLKSFAPLGDFNPQRPELAKMRQLTGRLVKVEDSGIRVIPKELDHKAAALESGDGLSLAVFVPFETITKAQTIFEFGGASGTGSGKGGSQKGSRAGKPQFGKNQVGKKPK